MSGAHGGELISLGEGFVDECEKATRGLARNDIEWDETITHPEYVLIMRIEDAEIVLSSIVGCGGHALESQLGKSVTDLFLTDRHAIESRLRSDDTQIIWLRDEAFELIDSRHEKIVQSEALKVLPGRGFPEMKATAVLTSGDQGEIDTRCETEDAIAGDFPESISGFIVPDLVFLAALDGFGRKVIRV